MMPILLPAIFPEKKPQKITDFAPKVGIAHHLRLTRHGIEAVIKSPRKYHRMNFYVLHDKINCPSDPFWVVFYVKADT